MTKLDWRINIENTAESVAVKYGNDVAASVFRRYNRDLRRYLSAGGVRADEDDDSAAGPGEHAYHAGRQPNLARCREYGQDR